MLPESNAAVVYKIWWLEYSETSIEPAEIAFTKNIPYDERIKSGHKIGMA